MRQALAGINSDHRFESARCDVPGGFAPLRLSQTPRDRNGRRARLRANALLSGRSARCFGRERDGVCARWARRHDGAFAALLDVRWNSSH